MQEVDYSLPSGTEISEFRILEILGVGGFGITYKAQDTRLNRLVAIKEFLPVELAARGTDSKTVMPRTNVANDYQYGLDKFLEEARTLASFNHPNIVKILTFLQANGTAYLVMEFIEGEALDEHLKKIHFNGNMSEERIREIIEPLLHGLAEVHKSGLLHRDIKPGNIYLTNNSQGQCEPMLIDFGAARQSVGEKSKSISAIISQGYAPPEQYTTRGKQGPYTDIYAVGAVMYYLVTGEKPVESTDRQHDIIDEQPDPLTPIERDRGFSDALINAITQAMVLRASNRIQNVKNLQSVLQGEASTAMHTEPDTQIINNDATRKIDRTDSTINTSDAKSQSLRDDVVGTDVKKKRHIPILMALILLSGIAAAGYFYNEHTQAEKAKIEAERIANIEAERVAKIEADRLAKIAAEAERVAKIEADKLAEIEIEKKRLLQIEADKVPLYISTSPANTKVSLLNPVKTYTKGMRLSPGRYEVELSKPKFITQKKHINLTSTKTTFNFNLDLDIDNYFSTVEDVVAGGAEIIKLHRIAAEKGNALAQNILGEMYEYAKEVTQSDAEAIKWYRKAARQGLESAQYNLGRMYGNGRGVGKSDVEAVKWYRKAAEQGYAQAQSQLGWMYDKGNGVAQSAVEAVRWYRKAAEQGWDNAQYNLGWMYGNGQGVAKSDVEAIKWYRKAAEQGYPKAESQLGWMYEKGKGVAQSDIESIKWYRKAAEQGYSTAQYNLGWMYGNGRGVAKSDVEAVKWYRKAAENKYSSAQSQLGWMYEKGKGVAQSDVEAVKWYRKAAEQGYARAQYNLGWMYRKGRGVAQSDLEALKWYRKSAAQGYKTAQYNIGWMYRNAKGVAQSDVEAIKWYRKAADQGYAKAQSQMGWMYEKGKGVAQSDVEAVKWYRKAAEQGYSSAQHNLGWMYDHGRGVAESDTEAAKWYRKAAAQGHEGSKKNLKLL